MGCWKRSFWLKEFVSQRCSMKPQRDTKKFQKLRGFAVKEIIDVIFYRRKMKLKANG